MTKQLTSEIDKLRKTLASASSENIKLEAENKLLKAKLEKCKEQRNKANNGWIKRELGKTPLAEQAKIDLMDMLDKELDEVEK